MELLRETDKICLNRCDFRDVECQTYASRECAYNLATRGKRHLRLMTNKIQHSCGVPEVPIFNKSDDMSRFAAAVSAYKDKGLYFMEWNT